MNQSTRKLIRLKEMHTSKSWLFLTNQIIEKFIYLKFSILEFIIMKYVIRPVQLIDDCIPCSPNNKLLYRLIRKQKEESLSILLKR